MRIWQAGVAWGLVVACAGSMVHAQAARLADGTAVRVRLTANLLTLRQWQAPGWIWKSLSPSCCKAW